MTLPRCFFTLFLLLFAANIFAADSSGQRIFYPRRLAAVVVAEKGIYVGTLATLNGIWYRHNAHSPFHFYNDNAGWMQVDKFGHMYSAYIQSYYGLKAMKWAGVKPKHALIFGGGLGILMQTPIEVLDGYSKAWGASWGDLIANTAGSLVLIGQEAGWKEQRIVMKFSYSSTIFPQYRPAYFGTSSLENFMRDYNGHTYWFSANLKSFFKHSNIPAWLNIAAGYGATGMLAEYSNPPTYRGEPLPHFERRRQFYLAPDIDLSRIKTRSKALKTVLIGLNLIKVPMPALEYNRVDGLRFHSIYF
ncbi:MAG: YfiM family protein [Bacteroidota bacterium]|nr:YfiM family protein [Bacteroidota bacterium]